MGIAMILTLARLFLVPVFIALMVKGMYGLGLLVFCIAGGTDLIDGTIARAYNQTSKLGAMIDPIADKLLLGSAFIILTVLNVLPLWFLLLAIGRDLMIVSGIGYLRMIGAPLLYRATYLSKLATFFQLVIAVIGLIYLWRLDHEYIRVLFYAILITSCLIISSGIHYVFIGLRLKNTSK